MSHYFCDGPPPCTATPAVTMLTGCVMLSAAAGVLITRCGTAHRLPTAHSRATARAIHLAAVAPAAQAHAHPAAPTLEQPQLFAHPSPARSAGQRRGRQA